MVLPIISMNSIAAGVSGRRASCTQTMRRLITGAPSDSILDVAQVNPPVSVGPELDQEEVAQLIRRHDLLAIPVVDAQQQMLGIVTVDDAMEVIEDNVEEGRTRWAWGQFAITLAVFIVLMIPYTFFVLRMFGHN